MSVLTARPVYLLCAAVTVLLLAGGVTAGARAGTPVLLAVVGVVQLLLILGWQLMTNPPSPRAVAAVALGTAGAADVLAGYARSASLAPVAGVLGLAVLAAVVLQLARGVARVRVTEALGSTLSITVAVASVTAILVLRRQHGGLEAVTAAAIAGGVALMTARLVDSVLPVPRVAPGVPHGGLGIVFGCMSGTAAGAFFAAVPSLTPHGSALFAWAITIVAVLADLAAGYASASVARRPRWSFAAGPFAALVATAPVAYLLALLMVR